MGDKSYTPWTQEDDDKLEELVKDGKKVKELAELFQRSEGAIHARIKHLGLDGSSILPASVIPQKQPHDSTIRKIKPMDTKTRDLYIHPDHGRVRLHFKTRLEISEDGKLVSKSYTDPQTGNPKTFFPKVGKEINGREYVKWKDKKNGSDKKVYIDELVCTCFHGLPKEGQSVVHIDGDISNSETSNLKWA